ncbi:MAG: dienelactone hydrolase family protein [Nakamurella sp.]
MTRRLIVSSGSPSPRAVVLVLHGGQEHSFAPTKPHNLAVLRMLPLANTIGAAAEGVLAVARLRFTTRGWNDDGAQPLADALWALGELSSRFPELPIGVVGHSMGGRVALRVTNYPSVRAIIGLAPWIPPGEPITTGFGTSVMLIHGGRDRTTSAQASIERVETLRAAGMPAGFVLVNRDGHGMLRRPRVWHDLSASLLCASLLPDQHVTGSAAALLAGTAAIKV